LQEIWTRSEVFHNSFLIPKNEALGEILENSKANGLGDVAVSPTQVKFLNLVARSIGAKKILEVGTLEGYEYIPIIPIPTPSLEYALLV